jgi:Ca2+-binding EF-hand superfamily protein
LLNIKDFFLFIIETEQKIERFRNKVQQMEGYEEIIKKIFKNEIDINKKGRINNTQLNKYLKCKIKEFKHKYKHSHLLFIRLDRNRDGYVTVNDILNELIPHS